MNVNVGIKFHNRFDIKVLDAKTKEVIQEGQAENIVLDRIYTRLCQFNSFFDRINFGTGVGAVVPDRTTLFNLIGSKLATTEEEVDDFLKGSVTKSIRLQTTEFNGHSLTEVGISDHSTNINTHALITDAEGNPISIAKDESKIIDIYATVYCEVYDVDSGLFFYGYGLRNYLRGGSVPYAIDVEQLSISKSLGEDGASIRGSRTYDVNARTVSCSGKFGVSAFNQDVKYIWWQGAGVGCRLPRPGVWEGIEREGVLLGHGDGVKIAFDVPHREIENVTVYVDGIINTGWEFNNTRTQVVFDYPVAAQAEVTMDCFCNLIPKTENSELTIGFTIQFGGGVPTPLVPDPDFSSVPGPQELIAGDVDRFYGYFGEVSHEDLINGDDLSALLGLTEGTAHNSAAGWLKFASRKKPIFVAKRTIRHSISWDAINAVGAALGVPVQIGNNVYLCRLLSTTEWSQLIRYVHEGYGRWWNFTNAELGVASGDGRASWTSTPWGSGYVIRGFLSVLDADNNTPSSTFYAHGFRPVLEFLYTLD